MNQNNLPFVKINLPKHTHGKQNLNNPLCRSSTCLKSTQPYISVQLVIFSHIFQLTHTNIHTFSQITSFLIRKPLFERRIPLNGVSDFL